MNAFRHITVALADDPADEELLEYARRIRSRIDPGVVFRFVHVLPDPASASVASLREARTHRVALQSIRERVKACFPESAEHCVALNGSRVDRLLQFAAESGSDVILMGHRKARTGRRSLARRLAMKAPCSLWLAPEGSVAHITKILVGVDFSSWSAEALRLAAYVASRTKDGVCTAAHVKGLEEAGQARVDFDRFLSMLDLHGTTVRARVESNGSVTETLLRVAEAEDVDLIVMGNRGVSDSAAVLLGSEAEQMLRESNRPVLVTRPRGERLGLLQVLLDRDLQVR